MPSNDSDFIVKSTLPPINYPNISVGEYLADQLAKQEPDAVALIDPNNNGQLTFSELGQQAQQLAFALVERGVTKQDSVLFFSDNSLQYVCALYAATYLGITIVQLKPADGPFELANRIENAGVKILMLGHDKMSVFEKSLHKFPEDIALLKIIVEMDSGENLDPILTDSDLKGIEKFTFDQLIREAANRQLARIPHFDIDLSRDHFLITYTSGTTGSPKGAIHTNRSFLVWFLNTKPVPENCDVGKKILIWSPIGHISGTVFVPAALTDGMAVVLFPNTDLDAMMEAVERFKVDQMIFPPSHARALAQGDYDQRFDLSSLEMMKYGGSKIAANLLLTIRDKYHVKMFDFYGSTEFYGHVSPIVEPELLYERFEPGNLGLLLPGTEMKIVDLKSGDALPPNQSGEICFRGEPRFIGYLNNPEATKSTIDQDGWYHSGDVGYYNDRGCLFLSDRIKELIKYKIWSIIPAEIEDFMHRHEAVESVCVVGVPHVTDGYLLRAYVKLVEGKHVTAQELIDYVKDNLGTQKQLRAGVVFVDEVPFTVIGKVDRQYFKSQVKDELIKEQVD